MKYFGAMHLKNDLIIMKLQMFCGSAAKDEKNIFLL